MKSSTNCCSENSDQVKGRRLAMCAETCGSAEKGSEGGAWLWLWCFGLGSIWVFRVVGVHEVVKGVVRIWVRWCGLRFGFMGELFVSCGIVIEEGAVQGVRISGDCWNFWSMRELQLAGLEMLAGIFGSLACRCAVGDSRV
ncbi:hypothetical protein Droror1_Dr00025741 [Drosera rotundifolia]